MFSLKKFIKNLQSKPESTRIKILWVSVGICMLIVVSIWLLSFRNFANKNQVNNSSQSEFQKEFFKMPEPFRKKVENIPSWEELQEFLKQPPTK